MNLKGDNKVVKLKEIFFRIICSLSLIQISHFTENFSGINYCKYFLAAIREIFSDFYPTGFKKVRLQNRSVLPSNFASADENKFALF